MEGLAHQKSILQPVRMLINEAVILKHRLRWSDVTLIPILKLPWIILYSGQFNNKRHRGAPNRIVIDQLKSCAILDAEPAQTMGNRSRRSSILSKRNSVRLFHFRGEKKDWRGKRRQCKSLQFKPRPSTALPWEKRPRLFHPRIGRF